MRKNTAVFGLTIVAVGSLLAYVSYKSDPQPAPAQSAGPCTAIEPQPGFPRSWESSISVSTYSIANARNGNLLTVIPIIGWSGRGLPLGMALYHNSANVDSTLNLTRGMGFDLGDGWTTSYSDQLIIDTNQITVIAEDGTRGVFTLNGSNWDAPPGVHDVLTQEGSEWRLTHKNQTFHEFDSAGLLSKVVDAAGNETIVSRDPENGNRITAVTDASLRALNFQYDPQNPDRLLKFHDPRHSSDPEELTDRFWTMTYDLSGSIMSVTDPLIEANADQFAYDVNGRITTLTDKDGDAFGYAYLLGRIDVVTDPASPSPLTQEFAFDCILVVHSA
jgi:hypothetical protein